MLFRILKAICYACFAVHVVLYGLYVILVFGLCCGTEYLSPPTKSKPAKDPLMSALYCANYTFRQLMKSLGLGIVFE